MEYAALEEQHGLARHAMQVRADCSEQVLAFEQIQAPACWYLCLCMLACISYGCAVRPTALA
jgi:hypothetical protein